MIGGTPLSSPITQTIADETKIVLGVVCTQPQHPQSIMTSLTESTELQKDIHRLQNWASKWQMEFNVSKCYCMHITHKKTPLATSYSLNGHDLDNFISHTYLGVHINSNLTWAQHIGKVVTEGNQRHHT